MTWVLALVPGLVAPLQVLLGRMHEEAARDGAAHLGQIVAARDEL